jgi:hypothetical protein
VRAFVCLFVCVCACVRLTLTVPVCACARAWCSGVATPCAVGRYAGEKKRSLPCSSGCDMGYYCPLGSYNSTAVSCTNVSSLSPLFSRTYCVAAAANISVVAAGNYSVALDESNNVFIDGAMIRNVLLLLWLLLLLLLLWLLFRRDDCHRCRAARLYFSQRRRALAASTALTARGCRAPSAATTTTRCRRRALRVSRATPATSVR